MIFYFDYRLQFLVLNVCLDQVYVFRDLYGLFLIRNKKITTRRA